MELLEISNLAVKCKLHAEKSVITHGIYSFVNHNITDTKYQGVQSEVIQFGGGGGGG